MVDAILERAWELKQALVDFVLEAEGELAQALETYVAEQLKRRNVPRDLIVDSFLVDGRVGDQTPIDMFAAEQPDLSEGDRSLLRSWHRTFSGLFAVEQVLPDGFELKNWLTDKRYTVKPSSAQATPEMAARLQPGEILLTRIAPVTETAWMFATSYTLLGKLGKPKLAVAIGNFKENHKASLYADAPDLLEAAWQSVEKYHQAFLDFFGSDKITLPGYQLNQKMTEFQEVLAKMQLSAAGIDTSKSLSEIIAEAGVEEAELAAIAKETGTDLETVNAALEDTKADKANGKSRMALPKVQLPDQLKKAEQVTVLAHPRWGQMFLPSYSKFRNLLQAGDDQSLATAQKMVKSYLEDPSINLFVWQQLAKEYPQQLEKVLQTALDRPDFNLKSDLETLLKDSGKPLEPELPEIASVPVHLNTLFEEAVQEVHKSKPKSKEKPKKSGFGAR